MDYRTFALAPQLQQALSEAGFVTATPIQAQAIPEILAGRDVMGAAQTGTGKTGAFVIPLLQRLLPFASNSPSPARHPVRALILTPTRELAVQIDKELKRFAKHCSVRSALVYGGVDMKKQQQELQAGVEIVVATPGRLLDHLQQKQINLSQCQHLVLDEADRMLDMGFLPDIEAVIVHLPKPRQTLLFSATFAPAIKALSQQYLVHPILIEVSPPNATATTVTQTLFTVSDGDKYRALTTLLQQRAPLPALVFTNTKIEASQLGRRLLRDAIKVGVIHGDKSQLERETTLSEFKAGDIDVLVATDVVARGLDIAGLPSVINYDVPYHAEDYVHRIGRTGRAGMTGCAFMLCQDSDHVFLSQIEALIGRALTQEKLSLPAESSARAAPVRGPSAARPSEPSAAPFVRKRPAPVIDSWFSQPYEPSPDSAGLTNSAESTTGQLSTVASDARGARGRLFKRPLPALLMPNQNTRQTELSGIESD